MISQCYADINECDTSGKCPSGGYCWNVEGGHHCFELMDPGKKVSSQENLKMNYVSLRPLKLLTQLVYTGI